MSFFIQTCHNSFFLLKEKKVKLLILRKVARLQEVNTDANKKMHYDVTTKTFIKILLFNARDHGHMEGTKQHKFTENHFKSCINSRREVSGIISKCPEYY